MLKLPTARPTIGMICLIAIAVVLLNAVTGYFTVGETMREADNDDLMRLVAVRDWLGGQGWFDYQQYRLLPPEGVAMHWSRYIDLGIAALLVPGSWLLGQAGGEALALVFWPGLLAVIMVLVTGYGAGRILGLAGAAGALIFAMTWGKLIGEFSPGRIDHHNVQLLLSSAVLYLTLMPERRGFNGMLAGTLSALSMAVGLEMLPFLLLLHGLAALRFAFGLQGSGRFLFSFGLSQVIAAPLFLAGQVPVQTWGMRYCDVLALPLLSLIAIGALASVLPVLAGSFLRSAPARLALMLALGIVGLWLASPMLLPCLAGPYADVTPEARHIIDTVISEARSIPDLLINRPLVVLSIMLPALAVAGLGAGYAFAFRQRLTGLQREALIFALILSGTGFIFALGQIRAINIAAPALPLLAGFTGWGFLQHRAGSVWRAPMALVILLTLPPFVDLMGPKLRLWISGPSGSWSSQSAACRDADSMAQIAALPPGTIVFSNMNLGAAILAYTSQSATSAPYHRSSDAFWNGYGALGSAEALQKALEKSGATVLALCTKSPMEARQDWLQQLQGGVVPDWLTALPAAAGDLSLYQVNHAALPGAGRQEDTP